MTCPACAGPLAAWISVPSGEPADPRRFELLRCPDCGSAVTAGDPPGPEAYEQGVYRSGQPRAAALVGALQRAVAAQPIRLLERGGLAPGARVLDAGAGGGRLVAALAARGHDAYGIEPSARSRERAVAAGLDVRAETLGEHAARDLDAVVMWHVLEHLDDPLGALERVRGWLKPGGLVLLGVPNRESVQARMAGPGWLHFDAPRHRVHLTPRGLEALAHSAGFERPATHHMIWEHNPAGMWMAILTRMGMAPGLPFHLLKRNARARPVDVALLAAGVPLAPLAVAAEAIAAAARRGGTVAMTIRRAS